MTERDGDVKGDKDITEKNKGRGRLKHKGHDKQNTNHHSRGDIGINLNRETLSAQK